MLYRIDYQLIAHAIDYYGSLGFVYVEVPWMVSMRAINITLPHGRIPYKVGSQGLVGSAEQSFVQMMLDGQLPNGSYMAASPCFRDEEEDGWHQKTFFKVELIRIGEKEGSVEEMVNSALGFFVDNGAHQAVIKTTSEGFDIEVNGIELGSYGVRRYENLTWTYGTGVAEPRFSMALDTL